MASSKFHQQLWKPAAKLVTKIHARRLSLHEYQSKDILRNYGIPVPRARVVKTPDEARLAAQEIGGTCIIKAQILGGAVAAGIFENGPRSGLESVSSPSQAEDAAFKMLNQKLLRLGNSGSDGSVVKDLYISEVVPHESEWYLAMAIDRENYSPCIIISKDGGVDLGTLLREKASGVHTFHFSLTKGITKEVLSDIESRLDIKNQELENLTQIIVRLYKIFVDHEATNLEINPLARSSDGALTCLGANFTFDNAAESRQQQLFALRDRSQEVPDEVAAEKHGLVYVRMDGNIGNVVNGAGLAMATNDAIGFCGGASANFLDAGGKATKDTMIQAFRIITSDERVKAILVNIYGGLTRCDMIAESIIGATSELDIRVPMVVRLQGTNSEQGLQMLEEANLGLVVESDFGEAARRVVELARNS